MTTNTIRFLQHYVTDGTTKARCWYSLDNRADGRKCVTIYSKDYTSKLGQIFNTAGADAEYKNDTDLMTDYFDKGRVVIFEGASLYAAARARAGKNIIKQNERIAARHASLTTPADHGHIYNDPTCCCAHCITKRHDVASKLLAILRSSQV